MSTVVVTFEKSFEKYIGGIAKMEEVVERHRDKNQAIKAAFKLRRFSLGRDTGPLLPNEIDGMEFLIERRANTQDEENCFYCAAPMATEVHLKTLEEIERALS